jgi:serine/threonine protein phosphatase PrpC
MARLHVSFCTHPGQRGENEDWLLVEEIGLWTCCVILDGMGGRGQGARASRLAGEIIATALRRRLPTLSLPDPVRDCLHAAIDEAHRGLSTANRCQSAGLRGSSTAALAALSTRDCLAVVAHVGQPFAFRTRETAVTRLFRDHAAEAIADGRRRGVWVDPIFPALGIEEMTAEPVSLSFVAEPGDCLVVCTDGIGVLSGGDIAGALQAEDGGETDAARLCRLALARGCRDNVTVAAVRVVS